VSEKSPVLAENYVEIYIILVIPTGGLFRFIFKQLVAALASRGASDFHRRNNHGKPAPFSRHVARASL
jgi:hypothetical protein